MLTSHPNKIHDCQLAKTQVGLQPKCLGKFNNNACLHSYKHEIALRVCMCMMPPRVSVHKFGMRLIEYTGPVAARSVGPAPLALIQSRPAAQYNYHCLQITNSCPGSLSCYWDSRNEGRQNTMERQTKKLAWRCKKTN